MIFPALLRRALAFAAVLLLAAFGLVLVHTLMGGTLPSPVTGIGAAAAVAVLAICAATIVKTDDYLTPRHTRFFFIATTAIAFLLAGGTIAFILTSENLPGSF